MLEDREKKHKLTKPKTKLAGFQRRGVVGRARGLMLKWVCTEMEKALGIETGSGCRSVEGCRWGEGGDSACLVLDEGAWVSRYGDVVMGVIVGGVS